MSDSRFDKVYTDPRFMVAPKKVTKVKIDKRFQGMFKQKDFNIVSKYNKYGDKVNTKDKHALDNFYKKGDSSDDQASGSDADSDSDKHIKKGKKPTVNPED